ncbi:hypothetical protein D3C73_1457680 [compost metagenome]
MVDDTAVDLAGIDRFHDGTVAFISGEVGFHRFQPFQRGFFAFQLQQCADNGLEISP